MDNSENKTVRVHMLMSPSEAEAIDDWGFGHRIRTRAAAMRSLCAIALQAEAVPFSPKSLLDIVYDLDTLIASVGTKLDFIAAAAPHAKEEINEARAELDQLRQVAVRTKNKLAEYAEARGNAGAAGKVRIGMSDRIGTTAREEEI